MTYLQTIDAPFTLTASFSESIQFAKKILTKNNPTWCGATHAAQERLPIITRESECNKRRRLKVK